MNFKKPNNENAPSFFPPLFLQRRAFILKTLKNADVESIVEIGCGEGQVLSSFCQPAAHLDDFPTQLPPLKDSPSYLSKLERINSLLSTLPRDQDLGKDLHLRRIAGLDIDASALGHAKAATAPTALPSLTAEEELSGLIRQPLRWEDLKVELWHGSLDVYNGNLAGYDAFVATEVVEHLPDGVLSKFGRVILGRYHPRIAIITTPDYDFREHFPKSDQDSHYYPDPTKRTDCIFRHSDHQFEFTGTEFKDWCNNLAKEYDYDVAFSGVGDISTFKPNTPEPTGQCASQCVVFTAKPIDAHDRSPRSPLPSALPFFSPESRSLNLDAKFQHSLQYTHQYPVLPCANRPQSPMKIRKVLEIVLERMGTNEVSLREIWLRAVISKTCGGLVSKLFEAVLDDDTDMWDLQVVDPICAGLEGIMLIHRSTKQDTVMAEPPTVRDKASLDTIDWPISDAKRSRVDADQGGWD